jgi:hypothetical protein
MCSHVTDTPAAALLLRMATRHDHGGTPEMNDQRDLEGLSAPVTGAASGIGKAAADGGRTVGPAGTAQDPGRATLA